MTLRLHSLQGRLLAVVIGVVTSVWLAAALLTWRDVRHELDELLDGHLAQAAAILVVQQASDIDDDGPEVDAPSLHRYAPKVAFQVFHEGRLSMRSANAPAAPLLGAGRKFSTGFETVEIDHTTWRVFAAHGAERDVQVFVAEEVRSRNSIMWAVLRGTLLPMAVALPVLALALWWAIHRSMAPLRHLGRTLAVRKPDALEALAQSGVPTEMRPMVDSLNGLFERIATLLESERRFTADASHELRTPIAAIRAQAQVALGETDDALRRHALQNTLLGCDRAIHLVEQLLTLSRLEAAAAPTLALVDMQGLARQVVADMAARAIGKGQTLEFESDDQPCQVSGNATLLSVLLRNLVDNAVRYSPTAARIRVTVARVDDSVRLCVEDSGPGLPGSARARLGERFFRVQGTLEDGSGLGWSIVRRIAVAHHMQLRVEQSADLGGLAVELVA
ncbi:MAG: sensor histidine kinase N-terminal domain-containing protein [Rhodoferax sp.]|nr:sensor histidine kinase N-terminal domain-containing protein [Rhodoferax sp.]MCF8209733.1 sensor histidine kinase N-terminal domain-containing protein [Rhodoferax sp.]